MGMYSHVPYLALIVERIGYRSPKFQTWFFSPFTGDAVDRCRWNLMWKYTLQVYSRVLNSAVKWVGIRAAFNIPRLAKF